jgi:hypothetical protein
MTDEKPISAQPTKEFFVEMMIRDIPLEQAVLDLVDNCVDAAKAQKNEPQARLDDFAITITVSAQTFRIIDNCGGFGIAMARDYAFRFGRPPGRQPTPHSIGQFGVGMKRALFKFGRHFVVKSATNAEEWAVDVDVPAWEASEEWSFPWAQFGEQNEVSMQKPGTEIVVDNLRPEVSARFGTQQFVNNVVALIKSKHRQFIADGLRIVVNGSHLSATNLYLLMTTKLKPGVDRLQFSEEGKERVDVRLVVGVGDSAPREAGWYVLCNGRVVLEADRRTVTGWGLLESESGKTFIPTFHNQFSRFRGIARFDSKDAARLPWNTMKTDVDPESPIWQRTFQRMVEMMRPVIDFLNEMDRDIEEFTKDDSPLLKHVTTATRSNAETLTQKAAFVSPRRDELVFTPRSTKIQYSRPVADVEFLQEALGVSSAKAVGERTFDLALRKQKAE